MAIWVVQGPAGSDGEHPVDHTVAPSVASMAPIPFWQLTYTVVPEDAMLSLAM
jgi:hypothetical protein